MEAYYDERLIRVKVKVCYVHLCNLIMNLALSFLSTGFSRDTLHLNAAMVVEDK